MMPTPDNTLKPCPFCGSNRVTVWGIRDGQQAVCKDCKATGAPMFIGPPSLEPASIRAVAAWNRRPDNTREISQDEREAFEAWAQGECYALRRAQASMFYEDIATNFAWEGWQARAALSQDAAREMLAALEKAPRIDPQTVSVEPVTYMDWFFQVRLPAIEKAKAESSNA
jgi:Lar family restriction alleviation protein